MQLGFEIINDIFFNDNAVFMRAYYDESGKHEAATAITICGLLMSKKTCKELQRRWLREAARSPKIPLPFHMSDCVVGSKLFEYLRGDEAAKEEVQNRMIGTLKGLDIQSYGASIPRAGYTPLDAQIRPNPALRNPWFLVFEAAILELLDGSKSTGKIHAIDLVFDRQDEFSTRAHGLFNDMLRSKAAQVERLKALSFAPKDDLAALQAADVVTYEVNRWFTEEQQAIKAGLPPPLGRWQLEEIRKAIPVNGSFWNDEMLKALSEENNALRA